MIIKNHTKGTLLAGTVLAADHFYLRLKGLIGYSSIPTGIAMVIKPCKQIHSCFMKFRFDAVFINNDGKVLYTIKSMMPWKVSPLINNADAVIELPEGTIHRTSTQAGDVILLERM